MPQTNKYQYCIYNNEILELHELEDEFFRNKIQTRNKYKGHLLCPGCHQVRLSIKENNNGIFLSAYPNSTHERGCYYLLNIATRNELREFYETIEPNQAERMLNRILEDRVAAPIHPQNEAPNLIIDEDNNENFILTNENGIRKYLPRRSLLLREMEKSDHLVMYYGEVKLILVKNQFNFYHLRIFRNDDSNKYLCDLTIPNQIYQYLEQELNFLPKSDNLSLEYSITNAIAAKLAFISKIEKNKSYYNGQITHSKLLTVIHP